MTADAATAPTTGLTAALAHLDADRDAALERLFALLRIRSISTDPAFRDDCRAAADWLVSDLEAMGFAAKAHATPGHPIVLATDHDSDGPHVLFYGHYDVQPVDPLDLWEGDPFEPALLSRDDGSRFFRARGSSDDKGQVMTFLEACRAWKAVAGRLPCKVTVLIEGEEESGGANLPGFLDAHAEALKAEIALVCDTGMWDAATPAITTMLRGLVGEEITVHAASRDLHSGFYGGAAANPITLLARALGQMHDAAGRVQIPGFYDGVPEVPQSVLAQWAQLSFQAEAFLGEIGLSRPAGETAHSCLEQTWSRPTAEVNGIWGGYTGAGFKTVIPAEAHAKVSFRLVGDQDPDAIRANFRAFLAEQMPPDVRLSFAEHGGSRAISMPVDAEPFARARTALTEEWGRDAAFIGCGGSIPVVGLFKRQLGMDSLLVGFGLEDDRIHSPNEKYELASFQRGARSWARILEALAAR
ncbi:MAG: M20/M25/M40 family metallo-hydrolase [Pseudomonadota bacterium]